MGKSYWKEKASKRRGEGVSEKNDEDVLMSKRFDLANQEHCLKLVSDFQQPLLTTILC